MAAPADQPFLRTPPFPGHRGKPLARVGRGEAIRAETLDLLRQARVGGVFWGRRTPLPRDVALVLAPDTRQQLKAMLNDAKGKPVVVLCPRAIFLPPGSVRLDRDHDLWDLAAQAPEIWAGAQHDLALIGALCRVPMRLFGEGRYRRCATEPDAGAAKALASYTYHCPFTGAQWSVDQAICQLAQWRQLMDANRQIDAIYGIAAWKRITMTGLMWDGTSPVRYRRRAPRAPSPQFRAAIWKSRSPAKVVEAIATQGGAFAEIEDGFIRSSGLGANCIPPLSAIVDHSGIYFDPASPSDLETILQNHDFTADLCARAAQLRQRLVAEAISKYGKGAARLPRPQDSRKTVLVTGQVEDDRSVQSGGGGQSNLALLAKARALEPQAYLIYKPHPDVEAGHRKGHIPHHLALTYADDVRYETNISSLIDLADAIHVLTSLAGFEALMRGKPVTTHGVPFYAGWGLTLDLGHVPARRTRRRTIDELVAATLLIYPRYLDPVSRLPCSAELLVERMTQGLAEIRSPLVEIRKLQGRLNLFWRKNRRKLA